jgi:asparagine synthase (glutamine-hydrolysing)
MCGICGFYGIEDKGLLQRMMKSLEHRGPDDSGTYIGRNICLGHRRLSIIDLKTGKQPISNENGTITIVFNGEIYNYKELRSYLESRGHRFYTKSDTEVIVHCYEEYGEECTKRLNGCFAFAIWDDNKRRLFLARDRHGIKPLYYTQFHNRFFFASEIKAILEYWEVKREVNIYALHDFLSYRCNSTEETMFKGIRKLMPGHSLSYEKKEVRIKKYWDVKISPDETKSEDYYSKLLFKRLKEAVKIRLMSDVPLGAYISGGIDSSSVVGLMSKVVEEPIKTFSVGFGFEQEHDELKYARLISDTYKTEHKEIIVKPNTVKLLPKIVWHLDEPMSDPTCIPVYLLSERIKKYATVVLTGDGGDEQFAGYVQFKIMMLHKMYAQQFPHYVRKIIPPMVRFVPKRFLNLIFKYAATLGEEGFRRFSDFLKTDNKAKMYLDVVSIFSEEEKKELYSERTNEQTKNIDMVKDINKQYFSDNIDSLSQVVRLDTDKILAEDMLMKADKMTMASAVEERVPFLDHNITELTAKIPPNLKLNGLKDKYILRKAMEGIVPKDILKRKKTRFFVPIHNWFTGELKELTKQVLDEEIIKKQGFFNYRYIEKIFKNYGKSRLFYSRQLWSLLSFQLWHKVYIEKVSPPDINKLV